MRNFDIAGQFEAVKKSATDALNEIFPVQGKLRVLTADRVWVEDTADSKDYSAQASIKSKDGTWGVPVYASMTLKDRATGKVIDRAPKVKMFNLPKITDRFSYIVNGNEYQVTNQLRLKPGAYTLRKQNGELKTQVNLAKGRNFDMAFDEGNGTFSILKVGGGQANVPLYPLLLHLGMSSQAMAGAWGPKIEEANRHYDPKALSRIESAFGQREGGLKTYFATTEISPEVTQTLLGKSFSRVDGPMLLASSKKLLDVHLGHQKADDRDSLEFKDLLSTEDFIHERIQKNKSALTHKVNRNIDNPRRDKITQIVNPGSFTAAVEGFFTQDDKSATPEQTNPIEMVAGMYRATIMGAGGIKSDQSITPAMREIHPSQYGFIDPIHSPEGNVGVNLNLPMGVVKDGGTLKATVLDKNKKPVTLSPAESFSHVVAFPNQTGPIYKALLRGKVVDVTVDKVDYYTPTHKALFSLSSNMIPYLASNQGNRAMMAAKQIEQAISLKHRESPLVQVGADPGHTMESRMGQFSAVHATEDGKVTKVTPDYIKIKTKSGESQVLNTYNNFQLNRKSFIHHTAVVKEGDKVKQGQLLADSNFTKGGVLALGTNLRTAYLPFGGLNHDDGVVITDSAAEKLTSEHIHKKEYQIEDRSILSLVAFKSNYPNVLTADNASKLDSEGVIKKGAKVRMGDVLVSALKKQDVNYNLALVGKKLADRPRDDSLTWTMEDEGLVQEVNKTAKYITVSIKTEERAKIGDKLTGRHGNKGVITHILPDSLAPKNSQGEHVEVMLNPVGVVSRINIGQIYESAAAKVADKIKKPIVIKNFTGEDYLKSTKALLKKNGVDDKEELFDAGTGKSLGMVHVGIPHIMKLVKQTTANYSVRQGGPGHPYDDNMQPTKGGEEGSKALDQLTMYCLLSHGARANLREMATTKSESNDEFWKALKSGQQLPPPKTSFAYNKFTNYLKGAGIDIQKNGTKMTLAPLTDAKVLEMSSGKIEKPIFYNAKDMTPKKGGLFDPVILGGFRGEKWGHMELHEAIVNPIFETAARKVTGLGTKFDDIVAGKLHLDSKGAFNTDGKGVTGGAALEKILKNINVEGELGAIRKKLPYLKATALDEANKKARYLMALKETGLAPHEAYLRKQLPIIPSIYRPVYPGQDGVVRNSDLNFIYQNVGILNSMMKLPVMEHLSEAAKSDIRKDLYTHVQGLSGLTDLTIKGRAREGFISELRGGAGGQPKEGFFISKLVSKRQDFVGRGTIIPDPNLGVDEVAIPEEMAWKLFEPFIIREMKNHGFTPIAAKEEINKKSAIAQKTLEMVMRNRHVLLNRAPSLHKFSIMAFRPKITSGRSVKIPPLVNKGFNGDFDGDQQLDHVLTNLDNKAVAEILKVWRGSPLEDYDMTARFKEKVPAIKDGGIYLFHLEDFPHGELLGSKEGEKGRIDFYRAIEGTKVLALDEKSGNLSWQEVSAWSRHYDREVEIVNLVSGRQVITDNDPRAVYGIPKGTLRYGRFTPEEALALKVFVPRADRLSSSSIDTNTSTLKAPAPKDSGYRSSKVLMRSEVALNGELGYLVGVMAGDGWASREDQICLAGISKEVVTRFESCVHALFEDKKPNIYSIESRASYGKSEKHSFTNRQLNELIKPLIGCGARNKHLPPFFMDSPVEFRKGLFAGLMDTDGSISVSNGKAKPQLMANFASVSIRLVQETKLLAATIGIKSRITAGKTPAGDEVWCLSFSNVDIKRWNGSGMAHAGKLEKLASTTPNENSSVSARNDLIPTSYGLSSHILKVIGAPRNASKEHKCTYAIFNKAKGCGYVSRIAAKNLLNLCTRDRVLEHADGKMWLELVENTDLVWDQVESIEKTHLRETGYDLTVPGHETFMNVEGVVLSNTMTVHVPITDAANREAEKMLPSHNLYQPGTGDLMLIPSQESQMGLYYLSQTPAGRKTLNDMLPSKFKVASLLDKGVTKKLLGDISRTVKPDEFATILKTLKDAGDKHSYDVGFTLGVNDLGGAETARNHVVKELEVKLSQTRDPTEVSRLNDQYSKKLQTIMANQFGGKRNSLFDMVTSGAKGSASQLRSILTTPLLVTDAKGAIIPKVIHNSYSEGLTVPDYWVSMSGARRGMMDRSIQSQKPGAFSKDLMAAALDNVISGEDCGTKEGIYLKIDDRDAMDRFTAGDQAGVSHNTIVDSSIIARIKKTGARLIKVRSPLRCLRPKGTCARCYGLDEHGHPPAVGENIGVKSGQAIAEPLQQGIMNAFHTGGTAGGGGAGSVTGFARVQQLTNLPKIVVGAAPLAPKDGIISSIVKGLAGGFNVSVGDQVLHVPRGLPLKVKVGGSVRVGDPLSEGTIKPQDLVKLKGMHEAQEYIASELKSAYTGMGQNIHRKTFETIVRSLGNTTKILNNSRGTGFIPGDIAPYTVVEHHNKNLISMVPLEESIGLKLHGAQEGFKQGHELDSKDIDIFKARGLKEIMVAKEPIIHAPILKGMSALPLLRKDWLAALGYRYHKRGLSEGAGQGWSTDLESYHPIPAFAHGITFGQGKEGKY